MSERLSDEQLAGLRSATQRSLASAQQAGIPPGVLFYGDLVRALDELIERRSRPEIAAPAPVVASSWADEVGALGDVQLETEDGTPIGDAGDDYEVGS